MGSDTASYVLNPDVALRRIGMEHLAVFIRFPGRMARLTAAQYQALLTLGNDCCGEHERDGEYAELFRTFIASAIDGDIVRGVKP